ncbi:hypothetical protein ACMSZT_004477 [Cronobacter dublinensis]
MEKRFHHKTTTNIPLGRGISVGNYLFMHSEEWKWQIVDHLTQTLSFLNQAAELNHAIVTMMEEYEESAQTPENQENSSKPPNRAAFLYLQHP